MGLLIIPGLFFLLAAPLPGPAAAVLNDFSQLSKAINKQIALVEADGTVREGVIIAAGPDSVTMRFASGTRAFTPGAIASAERMKDGRIDGVIKGALFGLFLSAMASQGLQSADDAAGLVTKPARGLADFSMFAKAINEQIAIVELDGTTREGLVVAAGPDGVTMKFANGTRTYADREIASAERLKDGRLDGVAKGILWGAVLGLLGSQGYTSQESALGQWAQGVAGFAVIGYLLDAAETNREALYRAPVSPPGAVGSPKASAVAFRIRF